MQNISYADPSKHSVIVLDTNALDKVVAFLVESGLTFKVVDEDSSYLLNEYFEALNYGSSYNDSGCSY